MRPGKHGGRLKTGNPGHVGAGGRPPDEFKRRLSQIASSDTALAFLERCANGEFGEAMAIKAQEYAAERGYGKVAQVTRIEGDEARPLVVRVVKS